MIICHTAEALMKTAKIAITIDAGLLARLDALVEQRRFPNRSRAVQEAIQDKLERVDRSRLARECANLDPAEEQALAEEGIAADGKQWPVY
jgi:Arc/MetJ-type ribon-helix-helix transcriptional regulator